MKDSLYRDLEPPRFKKKGGSNKIFRFALIALLVAASAILFWITEKNKTGGSEPAGVQSAEQGETISVHFIDVGQGDAMFIELTDGRSMLIDAGQNDKGMTVVSYIKKLGYKRIDYVLGTHPHADHIGGLDTVIDSFEIGQVYMPKIEYETKTYFDVIEAAAKKGLTIKTAKAGVEILKEEGLEISLLSPVRDDYEEINLWSCVCRVEYRETAFLFMADAYAQNEDEIKGNVGADVIKIGHHGSYTSTSEEFLRRVSPKYAVITVAENNDYGYPHFETMERLAAAGVQVYRTDKNGSIVFTSDGAQLTVRKAG